jgi:hypothetical protein
MNDKISYSPQYTEDVYHSTNQRRRIASMRKRIFIMSITIVILLTSCGQTVTSVTTSIPVKLPTTLATTSIPVKLPTTLATILPTNTPDLNHLDPSAILFEQDFESGTTYGLSLSFDQWSIAIDDTGNHSLCNVMRDSFAVVSLGDMRWTNYAFELRVKPLVFHEDPYVAVNVRYNPNLNKEYYGALNFQTYIADLALNDPYRNLENQLFPTIANTWYTLRLEVAGQRIKYYINDQLIGDGIDTSLSRGKAGFSVSPNMKVCFDDIRIWALTEAGSIGQATTPEVGSTGQASIVTVSPEIVIDDQSVGKAGNSWGGHQARIVRTKDGVFTTYIVEGNGEFSREWRLVWRQEDGTWPVLAHGDAGSGPVHLLASPDGTLHIIGWPNETGTMWSGKLQGNQIVMTKETIPGVAHSNWPYSSAGIDAAGDLCVLSTQGASPGIFQWACYLPQQERWINQSTTTDYGFRYTYVFPDPDGGLSLVSTRDVLWEVLGYTQPTSTFDYVFNAFGYWRTKDINNNPLNRIFLTEEKPTPLYPYAALNAQEDAYLDITGNMHVLYHLQGESTQGVWITHHIILSPDGKVINDVKLPDDAGDYSRIFQTADGSFYILSSTGLLYPAGDDGVTLGTPIQIDLNGYTVEYSGYWISVPRTGTPISNVLDVVFPTDGGTKLIYFQLTLPEN